MIGGLIRDKGRYLLSGVSVIAVLALSAPAEAQDNAAIQAQIQALQSQINSLQKQVGQAQAAAASAQKSNSGDLDLKVKWKGAPEFSSADGKFKMKVRGRLQTDYSAINQDESVTGRPDVSAFELRRARLGIEGVVFYNVGYKFEIDFANDTTAVKDAYVEYNGLAEGLSLRAGNFKTPNSIDEMTSSRFLTFLERAAFVEAFALDRQIGGGVVYGNDHWTLSAGIFGPEPFDDEIWLKDVKTGAARITWAPINNDNNGVHKVLHLGGSWRGRDNAEDRRAASNAAIVNPFNDEFFRYRARGADLHLADRFVSSPQIFDQDQFWGMEGAVILGPVHVVGEYTQLKGEIANDFFTPVACCNGADPTYTGWYVEAGWFLTGETRGYNEGEFGRIKVKNPVIGGGKGGGWGAWQIAGRYDVIDLTDKAKTIQGNPGISSAVGSNFLQSLSTNCTQCGEQKTWEIALNWWLNDYTGLQFQYSESDIGGGPLLFTNAAGVVASANVNDGAKIRGFGTRLRFDF